MPIYEYICKDCRTPCELLVKSSDARPSCPECGGRKLERQFSTFAAHNKDASAACGATGPCAQADGCPSGRSCPMG
ncbi:MAG: FmdB family zinc ribbon protein [Planctomycetota bacterium]